MTKEILSMKARGCERTKICDELFISSSTIKKKLPDDTIFMCVIKAIQVGIIDLFGNRENHDGK
ncbi:hypothetical protein [Calorimonas adulescens]|uniref:Uncharacterized protein n=1 Tax=Calorimonas adulescens TaxID=2606906 RepID=A0A5D8QFK6_9THEO|nr:hypothetical protein [Calorimonas adulescens]TZE82313.1 hypothetical protein FWJ32_06075 [Calorimonas adulescens]